MSAHDDYSNIQRRLLDIYERGHLMGPEQLNRAIDGITGQALQMVRRRRLENVPPQPPIARQSGSGHYTMGIRELNDIRQAGSGPYTAPLMAPQERINPLEKTVTIKQSEFYAICADSCAICLEKHKKGDTIMTNCCHEFGKECYNSWMNSPTSNHKCPTCRKDMPRVTSFKVRITRKLTGPLATSSRRTIIIEDDEEQSLMIF